MLQALIMLVLVAAGATALVVQGRYDAQRTAEDRSLAVAEAFAHAPGTAPALRSPHPAVQLQPATEQVQRRVPASTSSASSTGAEPGSPTTTPP
ncbi:hypothetical protein SCANM63S_09423 [Streptomyces canarius]